MERQKIFRWVMLSLSGLACLLVLSPFIKEILSAVFFAFALSPITRSLSMKKYFHRKGWVAVTLFGLIMAIILPILALVYGFVDLVNDLTSEGFQQSELFRDLMHARTVAVEWVQDTMSTLGLSSRFDLVQNTNRFLSSISSTVMEYSGTIAGRLPSMVISIFIFCCALYLFLAEGRKIRNLLTSNRFAFAHELDQLIPMIQKSCYTTLVAAVIVGATQASIVTFGAMILQGSHLFLIFLVTFIFSFIPVLGAAPVGFFLGFLSLVKGDYGIAIGYVFFGSLSGVADNIIRPLLVRGEDPIHPVIMLLAIIGAILIFGLPGIFLGPMFISVTFQVFKLYIFNDPDENPKAVQTPMEQLNNQV